MRLKINITGLVQGVGFRPFIFRLAEELGLKGYVLNATSGVLLEAEGPKEKLDGLLVRLETEKPEISKIYGMRYTFLEEKGFEKFEIRESTPEGEEKTLTLPDIAVCEDCLNDITDPKNRRFLYPFTNCTNCGPRFTIIQKLPYDRKHTTMNTFRMCSDCAKEYEDPDNRRFHAQPNACHACGPWLSLYDCDAKLLYEREAALEKTVSFLRKGYIVAVKGIGGYHLLCDASDEQTVDRLRRKKHRDEKPMAVMFPDIGMIKREAYISMLEERAICSIERPIVIVRKREGGMVASSVSPENSTIGVFLPYTPLHHLILKKFRNPVVATSANITDEPIVKDEAEAFTRLSGIADYYLSHNREIVRKCDDSVVRIMADRQVPVRRSRGLAPLPVTVPFRFRRPVLALGPNMNSTVALAIDDKVFLSQHIGDLDTSLAQDFYDETVRDLLGFFEASPEIVVTDLHPGYHSTRYGERHFSDRIVRIQHHFAHIVSCMTENEVPYDAEVIGFAFDGTGYGTDGTIWGGEVLRASYRGFRRIYHLQPYKLPGGEKAIMEPHRTAFSLLYETFGENMKGFGMAPLSMEERNFFITMLKKNINSPETTSMGRLFDGVASMLGARHRISYHAQAAIALEQLALGSDSTDFYPCPVKNNMIYQFPVIDMITEDLRAGVPHEVIARKFHNTVTEAVLKVSEEVRAETGIRTVALSGGVFQNSILLQDSFQKLNERGFVTLVHQMVPSNDGGISLGQAVAAAAISAS